MIKTIKNPIIQISTLFAAVFALMVGSTGHANVKAAADGYQAKGKELIAMINSGKVDAAAAEKIVDEITVHAKTIADDFVKRDPKAAKLVKFISDNTTKFKSMPSDKVLSDYHDGRAIDVKAVGIDITKEENEAYTDAIHTILHPIIALLAIKEKNLKLAKEQISEGLEQAKAAGGA